MGAALLVGALEALAIDRQNGAAGARRKRSAKGRHEANERILERCRIKASKHTCEGVVAWHPVFKFQDGAKKRLLVLPELRHLDAGFGTTHHRRQRDEKHLTQVMPGIDIARIRYSVEYHKEVAHLSALQDNEDTRQNPSLTKAQVVFYSHAIPLG
jgi:hypothetical protein